MRRTRPRTAASPRRPSAGHPRSSCAPWSRPRSPPATTPTPAPGSRPPRSRSSRPSTSSTSPSRRSRRRPSTTSPAWNGSARTRTCAWSGRPAPASRHLLVALGVAAVDAGHRVRYFTAADLVETLYRGLADNTVGRVIDTLLRHDLIIVDEVGFAPLDDTGAQLLFRFVAAAYERRALGIGIHWPFEAWGRFLPEHTTAVSMLDRLLHHATSSSPTASRYRMREARTHERSRRTKRV